LSVDVLLNAIGQSLFVCGSESSKLLGWKAEPARSQRVKDVGGFRWAHEHPQLATWVLETDEAKESNHSESKGRSLIQAIDAWMETRGGGDGVPATSRAFWQQVLGGCITQTREAFLSSQFELRRISRQLLPGLMRIVIWTNGLDLVSSTELTDASGGTSWRWSCVKYMLLHLRYLEESLHALGVGPESLASLTLETDWETVWKGVLAMHTIAGHDAEDAEAKAAQVEAQMMAFCRFGASADPPRHVTCLLDDALRRLHANLPEVMQLQAFTGATRAAGASDNALDRQLCIFLVPLLPAIAATLQRVAEKRESDDSFVAEPELSWGSRWLCLGRVMLSWLSCEDMFRWITVSKAEVQSQLLESLSVHLRFSMATLPPAEEDEELDRVAQCLANTWTAFGTRMKDAAYKSLMSSYLLLWLRRIKNGSHSTERVAAAAARLYSQRQQQLRTPEGKSKPSTNSVESWDDWDDDEGQVQPATPVGKAAEAQDESLKDHVFHEVLESLASSQLHQLREATSALSSLAGVQDVPVHHIARMREQLHACLSMK
jgi:hypothetical protein